MTKHIVSGFIMGIALLAASVTASATPISYSLDKVTFSDGTSATGFITFDSDTKKSSAFDIFTSPGILSAFEWNPSDSGLYYGGGAGPNNFTLITTDGRRVFNFSFADAFTNAGGSNLINVSSTYECNNCGTYRRVNGGALTSAAVAAVPEPATPALLLAAAGMFAVMQRRRKQTKA
jgi:hypothetical protein